MSPPVEQMQVFPQRGHHLGHTATVVGWGTVTAVGQNMANAVAVTCSCGTVWNLNTTDMAAIRQGVEDS